MSIDYSEIFHKDFTLSNIRQIWRLFRESYFSRNHIRVLPNVSSRAMKALSKKKTALLFGRHSYTFA